MIAKNLPDIPYSSLGDLAKDWECSEEKIIHYGIAGQLKICALSAGWKLQEGYYADDDPDGFLVPVKERWSSMGELLVLTPSTLRKILSCSEVAGPEFVLEEDERQSRGDEQYERFLSSTIISQDMRSAHSKVVVKKADLVVKKDDIELFLVANNDQAFTDSKVYDLSTMKKGDRETLILEYAVQVWEKYKKEKGAIPRIGHVHEKIKDNPSFNYSLSRPSKNTVLKPITEKAILKKIQSRKNAQKCG